MVEPTPRVQAALIEACEAAKAHGMEWSITPDDFGIRRRGVLTTAFFADADYLITVVVGADHSPTIGIACLNWLHFPDHINGPEECDEQCAAQMPVRTVELPEPDSEAERV